jgi:hypothetical protein
MKLFTMPVSLYTYKNSDRMREEVVKMSKKRKIVLAGLIAMLSCGLFSYLKKQEDQKRISATPIRPASL